MSEGGDILMTIDVERNSELDGKTAAETLERVRGLTAVAVIRGGNLLAPRGDTSFEAEDQLLALTHPDVHQELLQWAAGPITSLESATD